MDAKITLETKYKAKISFDDYSSVNDILVSYYLPIIRSKAFSLYNALLIDAKNTMINTVYVSVDRIISMINVNNEQLKNSLTKLELVNLIEVYEEKPNHFTFKLLKPLTPKEFNSSFQLSELFKSKSGSDNLEINNKLFPSMREHTDENSKLLTTEKNINISADGINNSRLNVNFDFTNIKNILRAREIDYSEFWTKEVEQRLLDLIVVYRISSLDIGVEIITLVEKTGFDVEKLVDKIKRDFKTEPDITSLVEVGEATTQVKLDYISKVTTKDYFISRMNRLPSNTEVKMISELKTKYGLTDEIINILVDFSIIVNGGAVNKNYIFKIADTLLKEGMTKPQQVINHLKVAYNLRKEDKTENSLNNELMEEIPEF